MLDPTVFEAYDVRGIYPDESASAAWLWAVEDYRHVIRGLEQALPRRAA